MLTQSVVLTLASSAGAVSSPHARRLTSSTNAWTCLSEDPPGATAARAAALHLLALARISSAPGPPTTSSTASRTASRPSGLARRRTPTRSWSTRNLASVHWSPHCGNATTGTPAASVSSVEFHPQCVRKQAVDAWASTRSCGLHGTTIPRPSARNPAGRSGRASGRTTQRNGRPVDASPWAISATSSADSTTTLPTDAYTTEHGGCASSHSTHSSAALIRSPRTPPSSACCWWDPSSMSGPTGMSSGGRGVVVTAESAATTSGSSSVKELTNTQDALSMVRNCVMIASARSLYGLDGSRNDGTSATANGGRPGSSTRASASSSGGNSTRPCTWWW
ncbi:hypothetical protein QOZ80_2AG0104330 [Eleusine coracana subsp. coracana]|nr:hypothetical protein QOZ80_2AG0104330 [Eleusine coracana subsp. coracana]